MMDDPLREAAARYVLFGDIDLRDTAVEALSRGIESPALLLLAGATTADDRSGLRVLFEQSLRELGATTPSRLQAAEVLKRRLARDVATRRLSARQGASEIINLYRSIDDQVKDARYVGDGFGIASLFSNFYSFDDIPSGDASAEREIEAALHSDCTRIAASGRDDAG